MSRHRVGVVVFLFVLTGLAATLGHAAPIAAVNIRTTETCTAGYNCVDGTVINGLTYFGLQKQVTRVYADIGSGVQAFQPRADLKPTVSVVRSGTVNPGRTVLWQARRPDNKFYGVDPFPITTEALYSRNDLYLAGDNTFVNDGTPSSSNIERIDFALPSPVVVNGTRFASVLDRGPRSAHDAFGIAAILSVDGAGKATSWSKLLRVASGWGNAAANDLSSGIGQIFYKDPTSTTLAAGGLINNQVIAALLVPYTDLVGLGTQIYGYSVVAYDVNPTTYTPTTLSLVGDNSIFPKNTASGTNGLDLPVLNFGALEAVPEPGTWAMIATGLLLVPVLRRRR